MARAKLRTGAINFGGAADSDGVTISGTVVDLMSHDKVGGVEVVFRSPQGEESTTANADGTYAIKVPLGIYRAFVRDDSVLSVGRAYHVRLPGVPSADSAGVPDELLMPQVMANQNVTNIELGVMHGGKIVGKVVDPNGKPIAGAVVAAQGSIRPALGTDITESDESGRFELAVPVGYYKIAASHANFAGVAEGTDVVEMTAGAQVDETVVMAAGCVVTGKVMMADGSPANDGAMERQWGTTDQEFGPAGRIDPGGTFRWVTMDEGDVTLRAWPWKSPPSNAMKFACKSGARFANVTLTVQNKSPDISGILVDHEGQPVPFAFVDLAPLDPGGMGQQERTDATGHWQVFAMPAGRYRFSAQSPDRGVASLEVRSPQSDVKVALGGLGRIDGTASRIGNGSFELNFESCNEDDGYVRLENQRRIVSVRDGKFAVEDAPACKSLQYRAVWHGDDLRTGELAVPSGAIASLDLPIGPPKDKTIHGRVTKDGRPVAGATVVALWRADVTGTATTDATGAYSLNTKSGARIRATADDGIGIAAVSESDAPDEEVDVSFMTEQHDRFEPTGDEPDERGGEVIDEETIEADPAPQNGPPPPETKLIDI